MSAKTIFWVVAIVAVILTLPLFLRAIAAKPVQQPQSASAPQQGFTPGADGNSQAAPPSAEVKSPLRPMMTEELFFRIASGMTYAQCVEIAGCQGRSVPPEQGSTEAYTWLHPDGRNEFTISFRNGRVMGRGMNMTSEAYASATARQRAIEAQTRSIDLDEVQHLEQAALQKGLSVTITLDEFQRIEPLMTYDECVAIIGAANEMAQGYAAQRNAILHGQTSSNLDEKYPWHNPGGYYAQISFHNGRVTEKTWKKGPPAGSHPTSSAGRVSSSSR